MAGGDARPTNLFMPFQVLWMRRRLIRNYDLLKIHVLSPLHAPQMAGVVEGHDLPGVAGPVKAVDGRGVLAEPPEVGVVQADERGAEHLVHRPVGRQEDHLARVALHHLRPPRPGPAP